MAEPTTSIGLITKYSTDGFDKVYALESCSSRIKTNDDILKFVDAKTVKVMKMAFGGLNNYFRSNVGDDRIISGQGGNDSNPGVTVTTGEGGAAYSQPDYASGAKADAPYYGNGYRGGNVDARFETFTLRMDRAVKYVIEKFDDEESGGLVVGKGLTEATRTRVVPEIDAYNFSMIAAYAGHKVTGTKKLKNAAGVEVEAPVAALSDAFTALGKANVPDNNQIIFMSYDYLNAIRNTGEVFKTLGQLDYSKDVSFKMTTYEGRELVVVPPERFQTSFVFGEDGYAANAGAKPIDFIVMAKDAAISITKFNKAQVLTDNYALAMSNMDGYVLLIRVYYDLFVLDNKRVAIYLHTGWFDESGTEAEKNSFPKLAVQLIVNSTKTSGKGVVAHSIGIPGQFPYNVYYTAESVTVGETKIGADNISQFTLVGEGDTIATSAAECGKLVFADMNGNVIGKFGEGLSVKVDGKDPE